MPYLRALEHDLGPVIRVIANLDMQNVIPGGRSYRSAHNDSRTPDVRIPLKRDTRIVDDHRMSVRVPESESQGDLR